MNNLVKQEQRVMKRVVAIGNGAHIYAPREWIGEEVVLVRTPRAPLKERILKVLEPYLEHIIGAYLYGSHARGEANDDSDIDLMVIANKKMKIHSNGFEVVVLEKNSIRKAIEISPVLIFSALAEAQTIINSEFLAELRKKYVPKPEHFVEYVKETKRIAEINQTLLEPYSLMLRLRGIFLINLRLNGKKYTTSHFKKWIHDNLPMVNVNSLYSVYNDEKKNVWSKKVAQKDLELVVAFLEEETLELEKRLHGKKRKKA